MLLKPLMLGISIDFGLLALAITLRFIVYPLYCWYRDYRTRNVNNEVTTSEGNLEHTIEIKIVEINGKDHYKHYLKI